MKATVYGIKNCDTMKKAFAWLEANRVAYDFHDYKKLGVPAAKLKAWAGQVGWQALANTRGPTWRKIPEKHRTDLTQERMLSVLEEHPSAIRRPIVEADGKLLVGFDPCEFARRLK